MGRYNPNRDANIFERILSGMLGVLLAVLALSGAVRGIQWLWHHFFN
ncbi:hypothetical protein Q5H93_24070 [Hymenobacter sp. ASUV-10]|uniref:Uncharacterized protein n=1 Tax=Hymenobacter aranciens TaxID=3063996 RepID=A0ABT9BHV1_9BACT|nr:hypothetical protein [Hymenobacter sp. ASUV-10]MDO7877835.1 hypothetical protein [Hymenobacter sp. ASUV-10]